MVRRKYKWKCAIFFYLALLNLGAKALPINVKPAITTTDTSFTSSEVNVLSEEITRTDTTVLNEVPETVDVERNETVATNVTRNDLLREVRPGQTVRQYTVSLDINGDQFTGRAVIDVVLDQTTATDPIVFHAAGLDVTSVLTGVFTDANAQPADYDVSDDLLEIEPSQSASSFIVVIEYTGELGHDGIGLYVGEHDDISYIAMNLHPTHARRVFPCMDEPTEAATISFSFNGLTYANLVSNSLLETDSETQFRALQVPPHVWGMVAHNFTTLNIPTNNVLMLGRADTNNQEAQASLAINAYFDFLNEWTGRSYFQIVENQNNRLHIMALPDVDREWYALSTIGLWEPYILMETTCSAKQRKTALIKIAEAMAKQWFGFMIYPENWKYEWILSGLATYAAYEAAVDFQTPGAEPDVTLLDMKTLFVTEVVQESLLRDAYLSAHVLEPEDDIYDEDAIRDHIYGLLKFKAPAILNMMRLLLSDDDDVDFIQSAASALVSGRSLQTINTFNLVDAIHSDWTTNGNDAVDHVGDYLEQWTTNNGYPLIHIGLRQGGVLITQERFCFSAQSHINFEVPLTFTTSVNPNFDNIRPILIMDATTTLNMELSDDDWVLFNLQGQGYYRVNYDADLWERIIDALEDPEARDEIHPLNRATLVDDALNLARGGRIDYDIAFRVVLAMEHETEYAVWKAFVRNMEFLRKRLVALVTEDDSLDPDIYLRMVRRAIVTLEEELGFDPDPLLTEPAMVSLTRGLVMDHACRANYQPCLAAAIDWFYAANDNSVNPNIPNDLRPAVYCTMVREGDEEVRDALMDRFDNEPSHYERVVILESLACSQDSDYITEYLAETISANSPYSIEERVRIFKAVAESSYENAQLALNFLVRRTSEIRDMYGGAQKLDEVIFCLADNIAEQDMADEFSRWVNAQNNNLDDSQDIANRALEQINEELEWDTRFKDYVYEWIDENDAPTLAVSLVLMCITAMVTLFNH